MSGHAEVGSDSGDLILNLWLDAPGQDSVEVTWSRCALTVRGYSDEDRTRLAWVYRPLSESACESRTVTDTVSPSSRLHVSRYLRPSESEFGWPNDALWLSVAAVIDGEWREFPNRR